MKCVFYNDEEDCFHQNMSDTEFSSKIIHRRGNTYLIRDPTSFIENLSEINRMINDLSNETLNMASLANRRAYFFKIFNVLSNIFVIISGALIGVLTLQGYQNKITLYIASVLGFIITTIQTILTTFSIEKRSVVLKDVSHKLRKISLQLKILQKSDLDPDNKIKKLEKFYSQVDELDIYIFDNKVTYSVINDSSSSPITEKNNSSFFSCITNFKRKPTELPITINDNIS